MRCLNPPASVPFLLFLLALPVTAAAAPLLTLEGKTVTAEGVTKGGKAVLFAAARFDEAYHSRFLIYREAADDDDGDGVVFFEISEGVPDKSVWLVADLASGELGAGTPEGFPFQEVAMPPEALTLEGEPELHLERRWVEVLLVRPGVGAWGGAIFEAGDADADGEANGTLVAGFAGLAPVYEEGAPAPETLLPGDLVAVIDPDWLEVILFQLPDLR